MTQNPEIEAGECTPYCIPPTFHFHAPVTPGLSSSEGPSAPPPGASSNTLLSTQDGSSSSLTPTPPSTPFHTRPSSPAADETFQSTVHLLSTVQSPSHTVRSSPPPPDYATAIGANPPAAATTFDQIISTSAADPSKPRKTRTANPLTWFRQYFRPATRRSQQHVGDIELADSNPPTYDSLPSLSLPTTTDVAIPTRTRTRNRLRRRHRRHRADEKDGGRACDILSRLLALAVFLGLLGLGVWGVYALAKHIHHKNSAQAFDAAGPVSGNWQNTPPGNVDVPNAGGGDVLTWVWNGVQSAWEDVKSLFGFPSPTTKTDAWGMNHDDAAYYDVTPAETQSVKDGENWGINHEDASYYDVPPPKRGGGEGGGGDIGQHSGARTLCKRGACGEA